jgi:hypothetical protein
MVRDCFLLCVFPHAIFFETKIELVLPQYSRETPNTVAIHTRVGQDPGINTSLDDDDNEDSDPSYFLPRIAPISNPQVPGSLDCRQWSVVAQAHNNAIQLFSIPLGWREPDERDDDFEDDDVEEAIPFYLTTKLILPADGVIRRVGFYSDDGKSSLSSGNDSGDGKEGRQKLSVVFQRNALELWMIPYDSLLWQAEPFESILIDPSNVDEQCSQTVLPLPQTGEDDEDQEMSVDDGSNLFAQSKIFLFHVFSKHALHVSHIRHFSL